MIDATVLRAVMPHAALSWVDPLNAAMREYSIADFKARIATFLGQVGGETAGLTQLEENLNYSAAGIVNTWPTHFDDKSALMYAHNPERLANQIYAGRMGNGPPESGDGWRYRGRGPLMLTGNNAYRTCFFSLGIDPATNPDLVATDQAIGARTAAWEFASSGCNQLADAGDFRGCTRAINGGYIGEDAREAYFKSATRALL